MYVVGHLENFLEALIIGVSDHHDGRAGRIVVGVTVRRKCPSLDTWKIFGDPFLEGCLTVMTVVQDGPS